MSKFPSPAYKVALALAAMLFLANICCGQDGIISIALQPGAPSVALVEAKLQRPDRELLFFTRYGHLRDLHLRISDIEALNDKGQPVRLHGVSPGRFVADSDFTSWKYRVNVSPSGDRFASAHISWANEDGSMLALSDLLPDGIKAVKVTVKAPAGWTVHSTEKRSSPGIFDAPDVGRTVIHAGPAMRLIPIRSSKANVSLVLSGDWQFSDAEAAKLAESVFDGYEKLFGISPSETFHIVIRPFPNVVPRGQWEADSRGNSVTVMSSDMPFKSQSLQRLHEQLRHEIFHLWIPNAISLTGNYDWFYEGFALYNSLKIGVSVNRIRFEDFLDTLSRAHSISLSQKEARSLIQESENRWSGSDTLVYGRGMLTAFACDLAMLNASKNKRSVADIIRAVFVKHHNSAPMSANEAILAILSSFKELKPIIDRNILGSEPPNWSSLLLGSGLELVVEGRLTRFKVVDRPTGREKEVLDKLGYNNWRKLPRIEK